MTKGEAVLYVYIPLALVVVLMVVAGIMIVSKLLYSDDYGVSDVEYTVIAKNNTTRMVTLSDEDGYAFDYRFDNFDEIKIGDKFIFVVERIPD